MSKEKKITLYLLLIIVAVIALICIPIIIKNNNEETKKNFPEYNDIDFSDEIFEDDITYEDLKRQLENDYYFKKLSTMMEYDSRSYTPSQLQNMLWYLIFNYEVSNKKYFSNSYSEEGKYCFSKKNLINAFKELYDVDISKSYDYIGGYYKYVYISSKGYCLDFKRVADEYNNNIKIGVERMALIGTKISADIYLYEYYAESENEKKSEILLTQAINNKNYTQAKSIVENNLKGTVTHKQIQFKKNPSGKYFKYKVLLSKNLVY